MNTTYTWLMPEPTALMLSVALDSAFWALAAGGQNTLTLGAPASKMYLTLCVVEVSTLA